MAPVVAKAGPSWEEWQAMHWRERQRVRREGLAVPPPPLQVFVALSEEERKALDAQGQASEVVTRIVKRSLARAGKNKSGGKHVAKQNGRG